MTIITQKRIWSGTSSTSTDCDLIPFAVFGGGGSNIPVNDELTGCILGSDMKKGKAMGKEQKTNAMRILDRAKVAYEVNTYECDEFIDGCHIADQLGQRYDESFKTLVTKGKSGGYFVFALPVDKELDLKAAAASVGEKSVSMIHVKEINQITGYIRGGCTPVGMKKKFPTVIDSSCLSFEKIIISGGRIGVQIIISPADLLKVTDGKTADITAK